MADFGNVDYLLVAYLAGAVLSCIAIAAMRSSFRVAGVASWLLLAILVSLPVLVARPLTSLVMLDPDAALPPIGITVGLGLFWIYLILPAIVPDFQANSVSATCVPAVCLGLGLLIAGSSTGTFTSYGVGHEEAVFDKGAGLDLSMPDED